MVAEGACWRGTALPRGELLTWQIIVRKDGTETTAPTPPAPPARFRILDASALSELAEAKRHDDPLVAGLIYAREGMGRKATAQFTEAARRNPESSEVAKLREVVGGW